MKKNKVTNPILNGADPELMGHLASMKVDGWEIRRDSRGKTKLYVRMSPVELPVKLEVCGSNV